jgi:lipoprotein-anchoring transpeptidase ErfK/SrfK
MLLLGWLSAPIHAQTLTPDVTQANTGVVPTVHLRALGIPTLHGEAEAVRTGCASRELVLGVVARRAILTSKELGTVLARTSLVKPAGAIEGVNVSVRCQIGYFVRDGQVVRVFPVSTGKTASRTAIGTFEVGWRVDGWRESRSYPGSMLYRPLYFHDGQAIHGMKDDRLVKPHPVSHGCVRVHRGDADWLWEQWRPGDRIKVYGSW